MLVQILLWSDVLIRECCGVFILTGLGEGESVRCFLR